MKDNRKKVIIAIIVFFALICLAACGYLVYKTVASNAESDDYNKLASSFASGLEETTAADEGTLPDGGMTQPTSVDVQKVESPVNVTELKMDHPDIYGWIYIPDTNVNYPVVQSYESDDFYLDHDVEGNYSFPGAIFSQSYNNREFTDRVTLLYGHNMLNGSMFATLHYFRDEDFFASHPYFYIYTNNRKLTYEVVTAFDYDSKHILNSYNFKDDEVFQEWIDQAKNPRSTSANVRDSVALDLDSKFVVLSTCQNYGDGRYLVQGVLVNDEPTV